MLNDSVSAFKILSTVLIIQSQGRHILITGITRPRVISILMGFDFVYPHTYACTYLYTYTGTCLGDGIRQ